MIYEDRTKPDPKPERTPEQRQRTIERLEEIARDEDIPGDVRAMAMMAHIREKLARLVEGGE